MDEQVFYTIAQETSVTYGMGDSGKSIRICKLGSYETGDFPPLFTTAQEARKFQLSLDTLGVRYFIVGLKVQR
jgi:hypothetical protein